MEDIDKLKKKFKDPDLMEIDEDSEHPVHEKFTKEKKMKR